MTIGDFIAANTKMLANAGIDTARLDCLVILEDVLNIDRASLLAHQEVILPSATEVELNTKIVQRTNHTPLAYIRGKAMFYGRTFLVTPDVLVPRPESESIITLLKMLELPRHAKIADIGTGSGCLGVTAALEIPGAQVWLYDIDHKALTVAGHNARTHHVSVRISQSDLLEDIQPKLDAVLVNLPYVPTSHPINRAAKQEPKLALFAGEDGLELYGRFWRQIPQQDRPPQFIITESLLSQHQSLTKSASHAGYRLVKTDGLVQCFQLISRGSAEVQGN